MISSETVMDRNHARIVQKNFVLMSAIFGSKVTAVLVSWG